MTRPSTDYWASHLYLSPRQRPKPDQPVRDLPPRAAQRFKKAREELRSLRHVTEQVVYLGTTWKWVGCMRSVDANSAICIRCSPA